MPESRRPLYPRGYHPDAYALTDTAYALLRDLISERTGLLFEDGKRQLVADKLSELVAANGLTSFLDYYFLLRYDQAASQHWAALMDRLAVPETYLGRQPEQIDAVAAVVAPTHFATQPGKALRIWSAACCTGDEPVSIAIALAEAGLLGAHPIEITATDGSRALIERARGGSFGERSFRQFSPALRDKYFNRHGDRWRVDDRILRTVRWDVANLADSTDVARFAAVDIIFCRNVFIYFSDDCIRRVVRMMSECMAADGCLFLGASESLTRLGVDLELAEIGGAFAYVRQGRRQLVERPRGTHASPVVASDAVRSGAPAGRTP